MAKIQVVIVSKNALIRGGLRDIINQAATQTVVAGLFESLAEADVFLNTHDARVLITDDSPHTVNLLKALKRLMEIHPGLVIIMVMQRPTASVTQKLLTLGVRALLHKDDDLEITLNPTIQNAVKGSMTISPLITEFLEQTVTLPANINQRDLDILQLLTEGMEPKGIAVHLGVTYSVVNRAINRMLRTYNVQNVAQLVLIAHQILKVRRQLE
ncbi:MAG: response regulator transcription factor [Anaerolinea sp.]|nr:response regulator transcription factor [Anaerolinea sp.]